MSPAGTSPANPKKHTVELDDAHGAPADAGSFPATLRAFGGLLAEVRATSGSRFWIAVVFLILGTLSEGISLLLLVPILHLANSGDGDYAIDLTGRSLGEVPLPEIEIGLELLLTALVAMVVLQTWFNRRKAVYFTDLLQTFSNRKRIDLFRAAAGARWDRLVRIRIGEIEYALTGEIERLSQSLFATLGMVQSLIGLLLLFGLSLTISAPMTAFAFGFGLVALVALHPFRRASARFGERLIRHRTDQFTIVEEFLQGLKTARSMNQEPRHIALFEDSLSRTRQEAIAYARRNTLGNGLFQVALAVGAALFVYLSLRVAALALSEMIVLLLILMRVAPRFLGLQEQFGMLLVNQSAFDRIGEHARRLVAAREIDGTPSAVPVPRPRREILLDAVTYHYDPATTSENGTSPPGLTDCTIRIPVGEATAVIGPSGAGKSTVADIVTGLVRPQAGALRIDGQALSPAQLRGWRDHLSYVPQETFLLHDTIRANLRMAAPDASDDELMRALEDAAAADFVTALPEGLDTRVGDRGAMLSGGERQRIALARAFLRRPSLLVLDEATSALDWHSQSLIANALSRKLGETTILTIAHRPSLVTFAQTVHTLSGGRLVEAGTTSAMLGDPESHLSRMLAHEGVGPTEPGSASRRG